MQRYFFHIHDGHYIRDTRGVELENTETAHSEAAKLIGSLWFDHPAKPPGHDVVSVEVTDSAGLILFTMTLRLTHAPAVPPPSQIVE